MEDLTSTSYNLAESMSLTRRNLLVFLGTVASTTLLKSCQNGSTPVSSNPTDLSSAKVVSFQPVQGPMPMPTGTIGLNEQIDKLSRYEVVDDLLLPNEFSYDIIGTWGDKVGDSRFGYNNDYLSFVETAPNEGFLTINFEYISAIPWIQGYSEVIGKALPIQDISKALKAKDGAGIDAFKLADNDPLKQKIKQVCQEALIDQGLGVISIRRNAEGKWERTNSTADRRVTGISGLKDGRYLKCTGPAKAVFLKKSGQGYIDKLGDKIIGTFGNCAGGTTPWGTVLSAEENFQSQVPEQVYPDGTVFSPSRRTVNIDDEEVSGQGNVFGLAGNKYGWIVEIDPANPKDYGTKHTWLGRYRHEAVGVRVEAGKSIAFYSGCDRRGGHIYKFVSQEAVKDVKDKGNSKLLENGMLYVAKFDENGTGKWIALQPETPVDPDLPENILGELHPLPKRPEGGYGFVRSAADVAAFKQKFNTLGDLYTGSPQEKQGAILVDAHYAANACGGTCTARPEDTEIAPDGSLFIAFTSGSPSSSEGGADKRIFKGPQGETPYEYGFIMHLTEDANDPAALSFTWKMIALGGEPNAGGAGFANPDNLLIDPKGNLWIVTDMSSDKVNRQIQKRIRANGFPETQSNMRGVYGNNGLWFMPTTGDRSGQAHLFALAPMESELTGPFLSSDQQTLFLSVQHPGEINGMRKQLQAETRKFAMLTTDGKEFMQERSVPIGSNWPSKQANKTPHPSVVAVRRNSGGTII
jgi:uncharacterized protein